MYLFDSVEMGFNQKGLTFKMIVLEKKYQNWLVATAGGVVVAHIGVGGVGPCETMQVS